ncbi:MAG: hypothetical protein K0Q73_8148, partial [Paenibacillus sp.]|nr:hypothetical protein [Paenibacillus sp.]
MVVINWIFYVYALVFCLYTIILHTVLNIPLLVVGLVLYIISLRFQMQHAAIPWLRLLFIGFLHYIGHSNLCLPLYILTLSFDIYKED